jgi:SAM-dependent methyltransferase
MDWWWRRFDAVIRDWVRNDPESMRAWSRAAPINDWPTFRDLANRGQVAEDATIRTAAWEAMTYQRGHLNAFRAVLGPRVKAAARGDDELSIGIVDLGCGSGTVAFAFGEVLNAKTTFHYVGQDHNKPSRQLCRDMLVNGVSPLGGTAKVVKTLGRAFDYAISEMPEVDRLFVTSSYLLCQHSLTEAATLAIAAEVERLVAARGPVRLVIADASLSWSKAPLLLSTLENSATLEVELHTHDWSDSYQYWMQFPAMDGRNWRDQRVEYVDGHYRILKPIRPHLPPS